ncbi:MAG: hypothetical protein CMF11_00035 [Idiomarina sp.]|nr:hypothetical protein [Idiomarina sp.]
MNSISINDLRSEDGCGLSLFLGRGTKHNVRLSHPDGWSVLVTVGASDRQMHVAISEPSSYTGSSKDLKLTYTDPVNFEGLHPEGAE